MLLHLSPGTKEDTESCRAFFQDLKRRGLCDPLFVATDGAPGLIRAVEGCFPRSERGRCLAHRMRNLQSKVPDSEWPEFREKAKAAYQAPSRAVARMLRDVVVAEYEKRFPSAVKCFLDDFEACIAHLRFPIAHRRVIRTTNLLERLFGEERRRMKCISSFPRRGYTPDGVGDPRRERVRASPERGASVEPVRLITYSDYL